MFYLGVVNLGILLETVLKAALVVAAAAVVVAPKLGATTATNWATLLRHAPWSRERRRLTPSDALHVGRVAWHIPRSRGYTIRCRNVAG